MLSIYYSFFQESFCWPQVFAFATKSMLLPIAVATLTYVSVNRLGEWKRRRNYSRLGAAVIESLQEEIGTGISILSRALEGIESGQISTLPTAMLPHMSWNGMSTISDDVLLRIIQVSTSYNYDDFHPRDCRIHCKNYFEHICKNYQQALEHAFSLAEQNQDWCPSLRNSLSKGGGATIEAAKKVYQMLDNAKALLNSNAILWFPK